jgi:hypothetical protein
MHFSQVKDVLRRAVGGQAADLLDRGPTGAAARPVAPCVPGRVDPASD